MTAIYKRDFRAYFLSPIGYVYIGATLLVINLMFYLQNMASAYASLSGTYSFVLMVIMFTTPILTMRTFSEDLRQKTDQLLFTAPVRLSGIVMGKFFAALTMFGLVLLSTLLWPLLISLFGEVNVAEVLGNMIGLLSVVCVYVAIGLFISSLTENQLVAAVGSLGVFIALFLMDFLADALAMRAPAWIVGLLKEGSVFARYGALLRGLFQLSDIVFFLSFAAVFLFLTVRVLEKKRWS